MKSPELLIASIGNVYHDDHAFGGEIVHRLNDFLDDASVRIVDFGDRSEDLIEALSDDCDVAILVDSTPQTNPPDSVQLVEFKWEGSDLSAALLDGQSASTDPICALNVARAKSEQLQKAYVIRRVPANWPNMDKCLEASVELTEAAVRESIGMITSLTAELFAATVEEVAVAAH